MVAIVLMPMDAPGVRQGLDRRLKERMPAPFRRHIG
jgi:hypothetical protein